MSDWTPPADAKKVTPAASGWKPPSDAKKADGAPFPSAPPASGEEGLGGPAVSRVPSTNGYAPQPRHLETGGLRPFKGLDAAAPRRPQMTPTALSPNRGTREDGTNKGPGWLGSIPAADGKEMTELSFDFDVDGKNIFAPLLVPTLSEGEVALLASGGEPTDAIYKKAQDFAIQRLDQGKSPFKEDPRSIVKKEKAEEIDLIGADRTTQQPSTIQAPQFDITPATAKQKKKAEEDARIEDRYQSEFSSATEEEVQKAKSVNQSMRSSIPAMEGAFLEGVERLKQQGQLLTDQRQILDSMDPSDPAYQGALDQYNERVKAFRKEQSGIELEALVVDDLVKKSAIDEFLLNRREHAIKAGHGNIPAAMGYASLDMLGKSMAGTLDVIGKVIPTDQEILEFAGALPEGSGTESRKEWRNYLKDVEKAPTRLTGIDQFVTPEYVDKKKDESLFAGGLIAVAEMAPAIAAGMATGGAGMGASFFTSSYRDLDQEMQGEYWDQIPEAEKEAIKVGTSFVSAGLSTMGMKALAGKLPVVNDIFFRAARKFAPGMSPGQLRRIIDAETKSYVANVASKIGQGFAIEGTEELADYGQEELVKHLYENYKRDELGEKADTLFQNAESIDQLGEGAWKSFVIGGIAGNMIGGSVAALSSVGARKRLSEKEFGVFKDLLESGSLLKDIEPIMAAQVAAGEMSQSDFDKTMEDVSKAESAISQIPEGLDIKATREAFDLLLEKDKLKTKDKILSAPKMQKIDEKLAALVGGESDNRTDPTTAQEAHAARDKAKETLPVVVEEVEEVDDRETTRFIPENPTASEVDGYRVKYEGEEGYAYRDGQALVIETDGGRIYEIGNAEQLAATNAAELGITIADTAGDFQVQDDGSVKVGRNSYINNNDDLTDAIVVDGEGNVVSVSLAKKGSDAKGANTTDKHIDGLRVFRGQQAEDLAYEILQQQMEAVPETEGPRLTQVLLQEKQNYEADQRTKAATGKPAQGKKGKGPAQVPKAGQAKEQVTTPNENEQPSVNRGGSDSVVSNTETNIEATPASVPEGTGVGKNVETTAPPDTAPPTSVQDEAPKPVAKKEAPSPGQGEGTTKSPYHSTSGKKYGGFAVTYDPEIGKMKTTMLGTPPPSGAEKFPVGSKERAKKSSNRIKAIRKARQEAEDELARKLGIAKDGRFKRGGNALENREEEKERRAAISKKADRLDEDALGVYGVVLRAMADGDMKITPGSIAKYLGWGGGRNDGAMAERRKTEEETKASWTLDDGGEHINNAAHGMMEGSTMKDADGDPMDGWSEADFAEAIAQVASGYTSSHEAYVQLERVADDLTEATLSPEDAITAHENAILNGLMEDADVEGNLDAAQASILNMSEAQLEAQYQDYLNTQRDENQEDTDGNDNQGAADSALGEQDDSGEEGASTVTEEDQDLADRISKLADGLDAPMAQHQSPERTTLETGKLRTDRVAAALKKLVPNLEIIAPKTKEEYAETTKGISEGLGSTWGIYDPRTNKLYLNPSSPDLRQTFFHEAAHPIIIALAKNNPELFSKFYEQIRTEKGGKYIKFGQQYSDLSEAAQMAEALAEFFGDVAAGKVPVSTKPDSLYQQFKDFIKDILAALGWDMRSIDLSKPTDVRQFAAQMKKAFDKGIAIEGFAPLTGNKEAKVALQDDADRLVDGWYSRLDQAVAAKGNTQSGSDWLKWAEARAKEGMLSMEEVRWTGLAEFLDGKNKVTSQEVRDFLKENRVKVEVVEKGGEKERVPLSWTDVELSNGSSVTTSDTGGWSITDAGMGKVDLHGPSGRSERFESKEEAIRRAETPSPTSDTKFSQYQLPGGTNYREVLVTLPKRGASQAELEAQAQEQYGKPYTELNDAQQINTLSYVREARKDPEFRSSHFDEPNILVHLRLNDRTDADGKKVLFIEELQSDWGQKGKKEGFDAQKKYDAAKRFYHEAWKPKSRGDITAAEGNAIVDKISKDTGLSPFELMDEASKWGDFTAIPSNIPSAPFVTDTNSWVELGLKQAIRMAAEGGYDRIAWTHGQVHTDRWGTERIEWAKQKDGSFLVNAKSQHGGNAGGVDLEGAANAQNLNQENSNAVSSREELEEAIRPSLTEGQDAKKLSEKIWTRMQAEDSGMSMPRKEGFEGFYDKILPNVAKKVSKKLGGDGKVGETDVEVAKPGDTKKVPENTKWKSGYLFTTQQSIEITDAMRDKVGLGVPLMQRPYGPIPTDTHKAALNAVAASVRAGEGLSKATAKGLKEIKASDWYKALEATQQAQAEADFKAPIKALATPVDKKPSTAPKKLQKQVMEAAGKKPAPKIVVNEKAALKDQIRMAAKNIRGERTRIAAARKEFVAAIKEAFKGSKGDFTAKQAAVVAHRAASVDPTNDLQVSRFLDYANKVIDNAEWADQVERADIMRGRAAKASKRKSVPYNHKEVLKQASEVDPAMLDNPGEYADIVQRYLGNIASPLSPQYAGTEQITEGEFQKYLSEWEAQMDQKYEDLLMDELGITVKKGQAKEIYKSIQEGTIDEALRQMDDPELKAEIESRVREMSQQRIAALKQHDTSGLDKEEVRIVKDIASADIDRLTVAQQADIIRASDNIILNNGFGGATLAASIASASNAVKPALDIAAKSGIRRALGIAQEFFSQSDAWTFFFGQAKDVGKIQNLVGFGDYVRGKAEFMKEQKKVRQDMEQFFSRLRAKYKDADSFENMTAEWVAGWVIQAMPKLNPKQSFEANKAMLQEDINRKMPTKSKKEAEMAQTVFDKIIAPANSREEALALLAKNYPSAKQSIDFMVNLFKPYRDRIQANSVRTWNMSGDYSDPYYLPKAFFTRGAKSLDVEPYSNKKNLTTMRPGQAGGTKARMTYRSLAENRLISPNIRNNVFSSLSDDLYGVATDAARMRLNEFMKMPDSNGVFGNEENKGFMAAMMHNYITAQDKSSGDQSEVSRWVNNRINDARTLASVQALAGFTQITRQLPEAVTQASVMMGRDFPLLFKNIPEVTVPSSPEGQGAADLMGNYAIGSREHAKAGMAWEGKVNSLNNAFQKAMQSGKFREAMKVRAKIQEVFMMSLMKGDLLSARAAWLGFYEKARKMDGHEVESWQTEASMHEGDTSRQDAALYADTMVNRMTVSSDPAQAARIAQRTKSPTANAFKALVQAFVGTAIQQVGRRYAEVSTLGGYAYKKATGQKTGEAYDPKRALMSLVAGTTGNAVFLGSRLLIASALRDAIGELYKWAVDDDDDDEEPSTKAKAIFGFMTALYMGGMMDSDIFRAIDKAERERGRKPKDPESESVKKYKLFKSQMLSEFIGSSIWQIADDAFIDGLNRMAYSAALDAGEPSAFTKGGDPKPFRTWLQDPKNAPFYRYGQTKFVDRDRWIPDLDDAGILGVFTKNAGYMLRNINNIFGDEKTEYKNEYQKAVKDIREASKERTEKASDIVARYEAGELTKEQSNKEFEKAFKDLPKDEYNKAARAFLDKRRYADAPDNVKEVLDINSVPVRVKMVRDMRSTMNAAEKKAFDSELRKANVMTDSFLKEYKSVKK